MDNFPLKQFRPSTLLCSTLVLLFFILSNNTSQVDAGGGKKRVVPVKQIFGVGIGYQKVTHYKPVLVFSRHRRLKQKRRRPGWGWKKGWKSYAPVHVQHHVHKNSKSGPHHRHGGGGPSHQPQHSPMRHRNPDGWGWRPRGRPNKAHHHKSRGHGQNYRGHKEGGYDYHNEGSSHPIIGGGDDYVDEYETRPNYYPNNQNFASSNYYYGNPYAGGDNFDDHGGYESEIRNHILNPLVFPTSNTPTSTTNPPPPIYPFTEPPKSDLSVTNIHRDFLRNHLKNFQQFQEYQRSTTSNENSAHQPIHSSENSPMILNPPGPNYSTMDLMNTDNVKVEDTDIQYPQYDDPPEDYYSNDNWPGSGSGSVQNYETEEIETSPGWNEVNKKTMPMQSTTTQPPLIPPPPVVVGMPTPNLRTNNFKNKNNYMMRKNFNVHHHHTSTTPTPVSKFKASPRVEERGSENKFNNQGFFPSFDQFRRIKMK